MTLQDAYSQELKKVLGELEEVKGELQVERARWEAERISERARGAFGRALRRGKRKDDTRGEAS